MITFNNKRITDYVDNVATINRNLLPKREITQTVVPGRAGAYIVRTRDDVQEIVVTVQLFGTKAEIRSKQRALASALYTSTPAKLIFDDEPDKYYNAIVSGDTKIDETVSILGKVDITFLLADPYSYSINDITTTSSNPSFTLTNNGGLDSYPAFQITFTAPATSFEISNGTQKVKVNRNIIAGDVVLIDCNAHKVFYNGVSSMVIYDYANSDFFPLKVGDNTLTVTPSNVANIATTYNQRWL